MRRGKIGSWLSREWVSLEGGGIEEWLSREEEKHNKQIDFVVV